MRAPESGPRGMTLVEVLVAIALLAVLSTAASGLLIGAARLQAAAAATSARVAALGPYLLAAGPRIEALPVCPIRPDATHDASAQPGACRADALRCRVEGGVVACDGGGIVRSRIRAWVGGELGPAVEVWSVAP